MDETEALGIFLPAGNLEGRPAALKGRGGMGRTAAEEWDTADFPNILSDPLPEYRNKCQIITFSY